MRIKKDILLKSYLLANTMHLTSEEYGTIIRCAQIEDDKTESRYENLSGMILELYKEKEEQWKKDLERMMALNPAVIPAYSLIYGQASNSRKAFDKMQKYYDNKDGTAEEEQPKKKETKKKENAVVMAQETPQSETEEDFTDEFLQYNLHTPVGDVFPVPDVVYVEIWQETKPENLPTEEDWESLLEEYDDDFLKAFVARGNKDRWKKHYSEYLEN